MEPGMCCTGACAHVPCSGIMNLCVGMYPYRCAGFDHWNVPAQCCCSSALAPPEMVCRGLVVHLSTIALRPNSIAYLSQLSGHLC